MLKMEVFSLSHISKIIIKALNYTFDHWVCLKSFITSISFKIRVKTIFLVGWWENVFGV